MKKSLIKWLRGHFSNETILDHKLMALHAQ